MKTNIERFVEDMKKLLEFEKQYGKLQYTQDMSPGKLMMHALENDLIKSSLDLVYICNELPELSFEICRYFDAYAFGKNVGSKRNLKRLRSMVSKDEKEQKRSVVSL